ncbi:MAG: hypothetical protein ACJ76F_04370 [Bacteroidia bacterium]
MNKLCIILLIFSSCWLSRGIEGARYMSAIKQQKGFIKESAHPSLIIAGTPVKPKAPVQYKRKRIKSGDPALFSVHREGSAMCFGKSEKLTVPADRFTLKIFLLSKNKRGPPYVS